VAETALINFPSEESDLNAVPDLSSRRASRQLRPVQGRPITMTVDCDDNAGGAASRTLVSQGSTSVTANLHQEKRKKSSMFKMSSGVDPELTEVRFSAADL